MKHGINGEDEMIPTVSNMPFWGLISVFEIVSIMIVTTQHCAVSRDSAFTAWNWLGTSYSPVRYNWRVFISVRFSVPMGTTPRGNVYSHKTVSNFWKQLLRNRLDTFTCLFTIIFLCIPVRRLVNQHSCAVCQPLLTRKYFHLSLSSVSNPDQIGLCK